MYIGGVSGAAVDGNWVIGWKGAYPVKRMQLREGENVLMNGNT